jgi:hypothetical protein
MFEAVGVYFERAYRFNARVRKEGRDTVPDATSFEHSVYVAIEPDSDSAAGPGKQRGYILVTVRGTPEATEGVAYRMVESISERITFHHSCQFRIHYGLVGAERLPDDAQEAAAIGEARHYVTASFEEVEDPKPFDPASLTQLHIRSGSERILRQFNAARAASAIVDRFLGYFRALELIFCGHIRGSDSLHCLRESAELLDIAQEQLLPSTGDLDRKMTAHDFSALVADLVRVRGNCAHLRRRSGYAPGDSRLRSEVEPLVSIAEALAAEAVRRWLSTRADSAADE